MTTKTLVPDHLVDKLRKDKEARDAGKISVENVYVEPGDRVMDPALLETSLLERLPQPTGWRVLVMPYQGRATTKGGVFVPDDVREREALATVVAYVLRVGPDAYADKDRFDGPWCKKGDWVCIGRYSGSRFKIDGGEVRIINDDEVIATILDPDDIYSV